MTTVTAAIIEKDHLILATRRGPGKDLAGHWEFPGGKVEAGESHEACLARELQEEFAIKADVGSFFGESITPAAKRLFASWPTTSAISRVTSFSRITI
jgi:8-oxo-dGTP diphosphatase